jgi:hypothetical protein
VGVVVSKVDDHRGAQRGYIAMLAVKKEFRRKKIGKTIEFLYHSLLLLGSQLVIRTIQAMINLNTQPPCEEVGLILPSFTNSITGSIGD